MFNFTRNFQLPYAALVSRRDTHIRISSVNDRSSDVAVSGSRTCVYHVTRGRAHSRVHGRVTARLEKSSYCSRMSTVLCGRAQCVFRKSVCVDRDHTREQDMQVRLCFRRPSPAGSRARRRENRVSTVINNAIGNNWVSASRRTSARLVLWTRLDPPCRVLWSRVIARGALARAGGGRGAPGGLLGESCTSWGKV